MVVIFKPLISLYNPKLKVSMFSNDTKIFLNSTKIQYFMLLQEIDHLSVTILMDNYTDRLLPSALPAIRPPMIMHGRFLPAPIAEHGFSTILDIRYNDEKKRNIFLFDTGVSENGIIFNADIFGIELKNIETIILSHGHFDHCSGLFNVVKQMSKPINVIAHPDAFLKRWIIYPDGNRAKMPVLDEKDLEDHGATIHKIRNISFLPSNNEMDDDDVIGSRLLPPLMITGEIPRETSFEKGFPLQYAEIEGKKELIPDPLVNDDQAIVVNIKQKGLVILTGCGHAGIINTINYAKKVTKINKVFAVLGGFHLTGGIYEEAIEPTIKELQKADPKYIIPCHCTGWKATNRIIEVMPERFVQTSVGTSFNF
jgi:7,8-dihydropterin-6-yl-methyl-4-(beta-D-ribofuranosyl)aminobenzene 5'-phosphate synthase